MSRDNQLRRNSEPPPTGEYYRLISWHTITKRTWWIVACFMYDPTNKRYTLALYKFQRITDEDGNRIWKKRNTYRINNLKKVQEHLDALERLQGNWQAVEDPT